MESAWNSLPVYAVRSLGCEPVSTCSPGSELSVASPAVSAASALPLTLQTLGTSVCLIGTAPPGTVQCSLLIGASSTEDQTALRRHSAVGMFFVSLLKRHV